MNTDILETYLDQNKMYNFYGRSGVEQLTTLTRDLIGGNWSHTLEDFLEDNPGAMEAIVEWIRDQTARNKEWQDNLQEHVCTD